MCEVPVFYATTDGQTRRIADVLAATLREHGIGSVAIDLAGPDAAAFRWERARGVMLGASVHAGAHQRDAESFVRAHLADLNERPSVFFSVSLSICSKVAREVEAAHTVAEAFPARLGWQPTRVVCLGGRLAYTRYGLVKRFVMRRIARSAGGPTDTSRDHDLTDWIEVRGVAEQLAARLRPVVRSAATA
jgi:menaquinone-dependent protoporphyrinogen oxidase